MYQMLTDHPENFSTSWHILCCGANIFLGGFGALYICQQTVYGFNNSHVIAYMLSQKNPEKNVQQGDAVLHLWFFFWLFLVTFGGLNECATFAFLSIVPKNLESHQTEYSNFSICSKICHQKDNSIIWLIWFFRIFWANIKHAISIAGFNHFLPRKNTLYFQCLSLDIVQGTQKT